MDDLNDRRLEQLLLRTDAVAPPPALAGDLAGRVRRRARHHARRHLQMRGIAAASVALLVTGAVLWAHHARTVRLLAEQTRQEQIRRLRAEVASLDLDASRLEKSAAELIRVERQSRRLARIEQSLRRPNALKQIAEERDRAALILLHDADRRLSEPGGEAAAAEGYRKAAELFPETHWADVARSKLQHIDKKEKNLDPKEALL